MGIHSSLKKAEKFNVFRSVMKRAERIKWLKEKGLWQENNKVLGLPKIKTLKIKVVKKEKTKEEKPQEATTTATAQQSPNIPQSKKSEEKQIKK